MLEKSNADGGAFLPHPTATNWPSTEELTISDKTAAPDFAAHFSSLTDPRMQGKCRHSLLDIITITILAVMCGADELTQVQLWGEHNQDWLDEFLELSSGIPSHDTFGRVLGLIDAEEFALCLSQWMQALAGSIDGEIVAIDGKTLRGSFDKQSGLKRLHLINAWARDNGLVLGQAACENGSGSEPEAVLKLLEILDIQGAVVTLDAGCVTKEIVETIDRKGADFTVAIKGNQPKLYQAACELFEQHRDTDFAQIKHRLVETEESSHGRKEYRAVHVLSLPQEGVWTEWPGARSLVVVISRQESPGKEMWESRYYLTSLPVHHQRKIARSVRGHWSVENSLHWVLDVQFGEDRNRTRERGAAKALAAIRRFAASLFRQDEREHRGVHTKRWRCSWDRDYLLHVLSMASI